MDFISELAEICAGVEQEEGKRIWEAASVCAATIAAGRGVFLFGAGHSALPCQEAFPRIGGRQADARWGHRQACYQPIVPGPPLKGPTMSSVIQPP